VNASQLDDTFTQSRANGGRTHDAIDIMAPRSTPVIAAAPGKVEKLFLSKDGGNTIYVRSPDGRLIYYYAHLDAYAPGLAEGQDVAAGAPLGTVGSTGNATPNGPHLHFAIMEADPSAPWWQKAPAINPYPWLVSGQRPELGVLTQRSGPSEPSASSLRRNDRPDSLYTTPRSGPEVTSTRSPVIR
jgi:murein DD-endopeptidase MepM/ murein hydrolase activator NlpD